MKADIIINLDDKCKRCGKGGITQSGYCIECVTDMLCAGKFDHILNKYKPTITKARQKGKYE